jgi:hypothetical protein
MKLRQRMEAIMAAYPKATDQVLAARLLQQVKKSDLVQLVAEEFQHLRRAQTQRLEQEAIHEMMTQRPRRISVAGAVAFDMDAMRPLLDRKYADGTGRRMRYGAMTVTDHQACIEQAMSQINAQQQRIALHRRAIAVIQAAGVECLDEVDAADEAA